LVKRTCPCCHGAGTVEIGIDTLPMTEVRLLRALADGIQRTAGELPDPGSTQRMAMKRLEHRGLVVSEVVDRHFSRNNRYAYTITEDGLDVLDIANNRRQEARHDAS
jgi:hypothetical protein